jgi:DNA-binding CsgD family transcriptional regulator
MGIGNFSDRELKIIELRTQGVKTPQIAKTLGIPKNTAYEALWKIYRKVGVDDVALLTRWAIKWGLDEPLEPERPEDAGDRQAKGAPFRTNEIRLGRIRRNRRAFEAAGH